MSPIKLWNMAPRDLEQSAEWFRRFADAEGAESPRYREWALSIAVDAEILELISALPRAKRQPVLILTCLRVAGVPLRPFTDVRDDIISLWPRAAKLARTHATQTNDPRRCSPLLAALDRIRGPISLIEVGASAGLTMYPDRYVYIWNAPGRTIESAPEPGSSTVALTAEVHGWGASPPRRPSIVHREGIDLNPLDVTDPDDRAWLEALVWPEQVDRLELVRAASEVVATEKPTITAGDALGELRAAVARARRAAPKSTIVVSSPAVLVYLDPATRREFVAYCRRAKVRWISIDGRAVWPGLDDAATAVGLDGDFLLSLDGKPIASVDPLGRSMTMANSWGLDPSDLDLIEFERIHWGPRPSKESVVRRAWGVTLVRYYQRLYEIMESSAARRYDPVLIRAFAESSEARARQQMKRK